MKILLTTNHLAQFSGSEIVVLELAESFLSNGCDVDVFAHYVAEPLASHFDSRIQFLKAEQVDLDNYDLVWSQHDVAVQFIRPQQDYSKFPLLVLVSLSTFEPFEMPDLFLRRRFGCPLFVNSPETAAYFDSHDGNRLTRIFHNACPSDFFTEVERPSRTLKNVLVVSNHNCPDVDALVVRLNGLGIGVRQIGIMHEYKRLMPSDLAGIDGLVSIGKTVVYGLASGIPTFILGIWGGGDWLNESNFEQNQYYNFSGRNGREATKLDAHRVAENFLDGFNGAATFMDKLRKAPQMRRFELSAYVHELISAVQNAAGRNLFSLNVEKAMADGEFRLHFASMSNKLKVIRREYENARRAR